MLGAGKRLGRLIYNLGLKEQRAEWHAAKFFGGSKKKSKRKIDSSVSFMVATVIQQLAWKHADNEEVRAIIEKLRPRRSGGTANLRIPHYWIEYYHNGFRGGRKKSGCWVFFPEKRKKLPSLESFLFGAGAPSGSSVRADPRRPRRARDEVRRKHVRRFGKLSTEEAIKLKKQGAVFTKKRKGWRGNPFLDKAIREFWANVDTYMQPYLADVLYLEFTKVAKSIFNRRFGVGITGRGPGLSSSLMPRLPGGRAFQRRASSGAKLIHFYQPIYKEIKGGVDIHEVSGGSGEGPNISYVDPSELDI